MKKITLIITFIITGLSNTYSQTDKMSFIELRLTQDRKIKDNYIRINIRNNVKDIYLRIWTYDLDENIKVLKEPDFIKNIQHSEYESIIKNYEKIKIKDFLQFNDVLGIHGFTCELEYGDFLNSITMKAWKPTNDSNNRKLKEYIETCNLIIKVANIKEIKTLLSE